MSQRLKVRTEVGGIVYTMKARASTFSQGRRKVRNHSQEKPIDPSPFLFFHEPCPNHTCIPVISPKPFRKSLSTFSIQLEQGETSPKHHRGSLESFAIPHHSFLKDC